MESRRNIYRERLILVEGTHRVVKFKLGFEFGVGNLVIQYPQ